MLFEKHWDTFAFTQLKWCGPNLSQTLLTPDSDMCPGRWGHKCAARQFTSANKMSEFCNPLHILNLLETKALFRLDSKMHLEDSGHNWTAEAHHLFHHASLMCPADHLCLDFFTSYVTSIRGSKSPALSYVKKIKIESLRIHANALSEHGLWLCAESSLQVLIQ